jgi:hypothetical protein
MAERTKGFRITYGRGFMIDLPNGVTFSTQFASGNYCENRDAYPYDQPAPDVLKSSTAEIAAWLTGSEDAWSRKWVTRHLRHIVNGTLDVYDEYEDDVEGWVTVEDWLKWFKAAVEYKP